MRTTRTSPCICPPLTACLTVCFLLSPLFWPVIVVGSCALPFVCCCSCVVVAASSSFVLTDMLDIYFTKRCARPRLNVRLSLSLSLVSAHTLIADWHECRLSKCGCEHANGGNVSSLLLCCNQPCFAVGCCFNLFVRQFVVMVSSDIGFRAGGGTTRRKPRRP